MTGGHTFTTITGGVYISCALDTAAKAWCWGDNQWGQLGDDDTTGTGKFSPAAVAGEHTFTTIAGGNNHACALDATGKAWCWGHDGYGQLGDGGATGTSKPYPVEATGGHTFTTVTAGAEHSCGLDTARKAWCWGMAWLASSGMGTPTARMNSHRSK